MRKQMKKNLNIVLSTVLITMTVLCSGGGKKSQQASIVEFKTMKVGRTDVELTNKYNATIRGRQDVEVYPQVGGTLQRILVTEGQSVKKGQTMFIIDQVPYQAALRPRRLRLP